MRAARSIRSLALTILTALVLAAGAFSAPAPACAMQVEKLSAQPNADTGSDVIGGVDTRITWELQADADEEVSQLTLTFPEGTTFTTEDARVTLLFGEDLMEREFPKATYEADGQTLTVKFSEPTAAGRYLRLEVYGVQFPTAGGDMTLTGTYELADGKSHDAQDMPQVKVRKTSVVDQIEQALESNPGVQAWNSNRFLRLFLNPVLIFTSLPIVFQGFLMALAVVFVAFPLAIPFGFCLSLMRISKSRVLRAIASIYVNIIRGTPEFLQIYIAFFGLPLAGVNIGNYPLGVIVMAMNAAAYLCEVFRAGIQAIPKGQNEAARSLGMNAFQTMVSIIIPQTFRNVIPTLTSEFILLYKDTSLLAAVGVMEIVMYAKTIVATTGSITPYVVAALFYLVITLPLTSLVSKLEERLSGADAGTVTRKSKRMKINNTGSGAALPVVNRPDL